MTYIFREYGSAEYIETEIRDFNLLYEECLKRYGEFVIYKQREFYVDGNFQCLYPHPIFVKNEYGETKLDINNNKVSNIKPLHIDNIKDIKI